MSNEIVIDRSRVRHKDTNRMIMLQVIIKRAEESLDVETLESALNEAERLAEKLIVSVPDNLFSPDAPPSARKLEPGWFDWLTEEGFQLVQEKAREAASQGKNEGLGWWYYRQPTIPPRA